MPNKIKDLVLFGSNLLKENNISTYNLDSRILLSFVTGFSKIQLVTNDKNILEINIVNKYLELLNRRIKKEPIQYIINQVEFMGLNFYVDKNVLIPRPDTEILVEESINQIKKNNYKNILEIGTGSGCISISLSKFLSDIKITAIDISSSALEIAKKNATTNNVSKQINFIKSDLFSNISNKFDCIISNPPYIETEIINTLDENVKNFEPILALDGGNNGLFFYKKIIEESKNYLLNNGMILFEIGYNQKNDLKKLFTLNNFYDIKTLKDYGNLDRVVFGKIN